jgi:hypothetical protein
VSDYAFKVGEAVVYLAHVRTSAAGGLYIVTQRMPVEGGVYRYRIRSPNEDHERIVNETELRAPA